MGWLKQLLGEPSESGPRKAKVGDYFIWHGQRYSITALTRTTFSAVRKVDGKTVKPTGNLADLTWHDRAQAWVLPGCEGNLTEA